MKCPQTLLLLWTLLFVLYNTPIKALDCQLNESDPNKVAYTITVDQSGNGDFTTIQDAINSIPEKNAQWIRIQISPGKYREKVEISVKRPCLFLEGAGSDFTSIEWDDHAVTSTSSTFTSYPDNIVIKGITFKNSYLLEAGVDYSSKQAVAARIHGDKCAIYNCAFQGIQDTFWDEMGRHYYSECYFEGAIDFIFGKAQSIYENCVINVSVGKYKGESTGFITAQKKEWADHGSGFVFKNCNISGTGKAYLGRAWGPHATVVISHSTMSDVVLPQGWFAWDYVGHEENFTFVESNNEGPGADTSERVDWEKKLTASELDKFLDISFIDTEGWLAKLPTSS